MLNDLVDRNAFCGTPVLICLSFKSVAFILSNACLSSFYVACYELDDDVRNVCYCEFVYEFVHVHCIKRLAHVQSYNYSAFWRP